MANRTGKYLGVRIHRDPELVIRENYGKALTKLEGQVDRWIRLPLSLADRIAIQKMVVLSRFLYLFTNIPVWFTQQLFIKLRAYMTKLTWAGKQTGVG